MSRAIISGLVSFRLAIIYNNATKGSAAVSNAHQVWFDFSDHPLVDDTIDVNIDTATNKEAIADLLESAKVKTLPAIFFLESNEGQEQQKIITRLIGNPSYNTISNTMKAVIAQKYTEQGAGNSNTDGKEGGTPLGWLGLLKLPRFLWYVVAAAAGVKAIDSKAAGKVVYGGITIYALHRAKRK